MGWPTPRRQPHQLHPKHRLDNHRPLDHTTQPLTHPAEVTANAVILLSSLLKRIATTA